MGYSTKFTKKWLVQNKGGEGRTSQVSLLSNIKNKIIIYLITYRSSFSKFKLMAARLKSKSRIIRGKNAVDFRQIHLLSISLMVFHDFYQTQPWL